MSIGKKLLANAAVNRLFSQFSPFSVDSKRPTAWADYGYPKNPTFDDYWSMYRRNGLGRAGVVRHIEKTWQTYPTILESDEAHDQTAWEKEIDRLFKRIRFWRALKGADERNRVGKYAGLIFIFADNKRPDEPVDRVPGGTKGLVKVIPAFEGQLDATEWDSDPMSPTYGEPVMFNYNEGELGDHDSRDPGRTMQVHASRVHIWAEGADDGSIYGIPALESGLNDLITIEKIVGAGGEGFWKTARAPMKMNIAPDANLTTLANMLDTDVAGIADKMDEVIADFYSGADKSLLTQGIDSQNLTITLPSPQQFFDVAMQGFAASVSCPLPILLGHQTGDRASQEDSNEWNSTIMARRSSFVVPEIERIVEYLMKVGVIRERDFVVDWDDLTAPSLEDKLANADKMATINQKSMGTGEGAPFSSNEIREVADYEVEDDLDDFEEGDVDGDDEEPSTPPQPE